MKKQRIGIFDLGRIPVTHVQREESVGTLRQFRESEDRKAREAEARTQAEIERVQKDTSRLMVECLSVSAPLMGKFWSSSIDNIKAHLHDDDVFDNLFLPTSEETVDSNAVYDVIQAFLPTVPALTGWLLMERAKRRFGLYVASQVNAGVVITPESLLVMMRRCIDLNIFKAGAFDAEASFDEALAPREQPRVERPVEQPRRESLEDFESLDTTTTRDGSRRAKNLAENLYVEEMIPVATAWVTSIQKHYGFSPTSEDMKRVSSWIERNNLNRLAHQTYDAARRWMVASGYWPESCLMEAEKFRIALEKIETARLTPQQRNDLNRKELQAREADARRFGQ